MYRTHMYLPGTIYYKSLSNLCKERSPQDLKILQLAACPCTSSGIITFTSIVAHHPFINPHLYVVSNVVPKQ